MKQILGIDAGGTKIASGLVDEHFRVRQVRLEPTAQGGLTRQLVGLIKKYKTFDGIGLGVPGPVTAGGFVAELPNIKGFKAMNLQAYLGRHFAVPIKVLNDAKAFALAEAVAGAGKRAETVLGVVLGTGIGSGFVDHKRIYSGNNRVASEIGRILIENNLTLEQAMRQQGPSAAGLEPIIKVILTLAVRVIGPELIIFGGGRARNPSFPQVLERCRRTLLRHPASPRVKVSQLKHAGVIGAALPLLKP
mgnify:CR=1 FL=1